MALPRDHNPRTPAPPVRAVSPAASSGGRGASPPRRRPDPRPSRLALAAGGLATVSALLAFIGGAAIPVAAVAPGASADAASTGGGGVGGGAPVRHVVRIVTLAPGELPPAGAAAAPAAPGTLAVPVSPPRVTRQPTIRTSQSGQP